MIKTNDLQPGDRVRLIDFGGTELFYCRRLFELGMTWGAEVLIVRRAPLGCPLQIEVRGTSLMLRVDEAALRCWESV